MKTCPKSQVYRIIKKKDNKKPIIDKKNELGKKNK